MPIPTPFHPRTSALNTAMRWKDWAGYHAVSSFDTYHEREYFAFRHTAGLIDVTPLFKYDVTGPDAATFLARVMARDITKLRVGRVTYASWCDDDGKLLDDGTVWRLDDDEFRVTAAEPALAWFHRNATGLDVNIADTTDRIAAVSLQGPRSREILAAVAGDEIRDLRFFRLLHAVTAGGQGLYVTRTGYTGDLGYEIWCSNEDALALWDALIEAGQPHGLVPAGLDALDMTRIEAGFILNGIDYYPANRCLIESRKSTPYETGLGWTVQLDREAFNGQEALRREKERGPDRVFVGLEIDWDEYEELFAKHGLPPEVPNHAWRDAVPIYTQSGDQIGQATSGSWSPMLKKNLALATVAAEYAGIGRDVHIEVTAEYTRHRVTATVTETPFYDPPRKRS